MHNGVPCFSPTGTWIYLRYPRITWSKMTSLIVRSIRHDWWASSTCSTRIVWSTWSADWALPRGRSWCPFRQALTSLRSRIGTTMPRARPPRRCNRLSLIRNRCETGQFIWTINLMENNGGEFWIDQLNVIESLYP